MAIEVTISRNPETGKATTERHEAGREFFVSDGHLFVQRDSANSRRSTVAAYAPGKWQSAQQAD